MNKKKFSNFIYFFLKSLISVLFIFSQQNTHSQTFLNQDLIPNLVFYDAKEININKNDESFELNGNALILIGSIYISANKIALQKKVGLLSAEGNVNLINNKQKVIASRIIIDLYTKQLRMDDALIISDPKDTDDLFTEKTLGITKAEVAYEVSKEKRAKELENELKDLREEYSKIQNLIKFKSSNEKNYKEKIDQITAKYARLLARLTRTQFQPNAFLEKLSEKDRQKLIDRRAAVEKFKSNNPEIAQKIANFSSIEGYIKIAASQIIQKNNNTLLLNNSIITPCNCSTVFNEPPIYGFSSEKAKIEIDDYITMQDVTFDIFSIPVFYSPWLKFPIKNKRESGFLTPSSYLSSNAGSATSIPYFIVLGSHADSTVVYEYFTNRGSQFSGEFRFQIDQDSLFSAEGKFIKDKNYSNDNNINNQKINSIITENSTQIEKNTYNSYRGKDTDNRWYVNSSINIPITNSGSIKTNYENTSDNLYLSDFSNNNSNINPVAAVYGDTSSASKRYLNQDFSTEYYGDNVIMSLKAQFTKDLFSANSNSTPQKTPKFEFDLLPAKYFSTPFIFSNHTTFENITRPNNENYIPIPQNLFTNSASNSLTGVYDSDNQKNPNDPYAQGKRTYTSSTFTLPLPSNDFFNSNFSTTAIGTQYYFPNTYPYTNVQPYLGYLLYNLHLDIPLYSEISFANDNNIRTNITHNFKPFIDFNYIPTVIRSSNFPSTYQLWYDQDKKVSEAILNIGATLSWSIEKEQFIETRNNPARLPSTAEPGVANLDFLTTIIANEKRNLSNDTQYIYNLSSQKNSHKIFESWAKTELENYYSKVTTHELNQNYIWPSGSFYSKKTILAFTPLSLTVSTGYNFLADQTANEANKLAGPAFSPVPPQKFTDIVGSANINLNPYFPAQANLNLAYNQLYKRLSSMSSDITMDLPYGLGISYAYSQQFVNNPNSSSQENFIKKTQQSAALNYSPLTWLKLSSQWSKNTDDSSITDASNGKDYASSQSITFLNLQNCLDLILARNKQAGIPEHMSTYVISLTFRFFGYSYTTRQLGDYLDRKIKD